MNLTPLTLARPDSGSQSDAVQKPAAEKSNEFDTLVEKAKDTPKTEEDVKEVAPTGPTAPAQMLDLAAIALLAAPTQTLPQPSVALEGSRAFSISPTTAPTKASAQAIVVTPDSAETTVGTRVEQAPEAPITPQAAQASKTNVNVTDLKGSGQAESKEVKNLLTDLGAQKVVVEDDPAATPQTDQATEASKKQVQAAVEKAQPKVQTGSQKVSDPENKDAKPSVDLTVKETRHTRSQKDATSDHQDKEQPEDGPMAPEAAPVAVQAEPTRTQAVSHEPKKPASNVQDVARQVADKVKDLVDAKRPGKVTVILEPAHLGSVTVTVRHSGNKFSADIQTSDPILSQQLADNKKELVQAAESRGLSLDSFNVGQQGQGSENPQGQASLQQEMQRTHRVNQATLSTLPDTTQPTAPRRTSAGHGLDMTA